MPSKLQLFALPFAGGNAASFRKLESLLSPHIEWITIEYAGRGNRRKEGYITDYDDFLKDVADQIQAKRDPSADFALFGYSLGSALTYDLLSRGMVEGCPVHAFICARGSLQHNVMGQSFTQMSEQDFAERMRKLGGMDERILKSPRFLHIYIQPVRADYIIWGQYRFHPGEMGCDTSVLYSPLDPVSQGGEDWTELTNGKVDYFPMGDNHFFIHQHWQDVAEIVNRHLLPYR